MADFAACAEALDRTDPLAGFRSRFILPDGVIYLDGNSLGLMQNSVASRLARTASKEWAEGVIRSWGGAGWFDLPMTAGDRIAPLIGVGRGEVAVGDSTSANLFKCLAAALHLRPGRSVILAEGDNFPTDTYIASGLAGLVERAELRFLEPGEALSDRIDAETAVVMMSHVDYRTAEIRDMAAVNAAAHAAGALVIWDLSHSTGAVPVDLLAADADMAVGCTYKYLNGGPGAPAFAWIHSRFYPEVRQPLSGWMGHLAPFGFERDYAAAPGARRLVCGTPQILSLAALDEALAIWDDVDLAALFEKGRRMTAFFIEVVETECRDLGLQLAVPRDCDRRGSHVSFRHASGFEIMQALASEGVIGDFRAPDTMRFGFAPLYLTFTEVYQAAVRLRDILVERRWDTPAFRKRTLVT